MSRYRLKRRSSLVRFILFVCLFVCFLFLHANDFSRIELQKLIPGLRAWRDEARQHAIEAGRGQLGHENPIFRTRIDPVKVDHFINYISRPDLLQDVAFGTKTLKLDS